MGNFILSLIGLYIIWKLCKLGKYYFDLIPDQIATIPKPTKAPRIVFDFEYTNCGNCAEWELEAALEKYGYVKVDNLTDTLAPGEFHLGYDYKDMRNACIYRNPREVFTIAHKSIVDYDNVQKMIQDALKNNQLTAEDRRRKEEWQDTILSQGYYQGGR